MPPFYQPRRGGIIEVASEQAVQNILDESTKESDTNDECFNREEEFINEYIQQNSKRIQSASSCLTTESSSVFQDTDSIEPKNQRKLTRHASARRLFEVNEWDEQQKRLKQQTKKSETRPSHSYNEIKALTTELLQDYDQLINKHDFENTRRREFIYRNYRCNVREPFLLAKIKQFEQLEKTRASRTRFKTDQYNQFLQFINKHHYITQDDYDKREYDALAQFNEEIGQIHTRCLADPTLLSYHKWMNERRTLSSVGCRSQTQKVDDPRRIVSEQGFRSYHRTATPLSNGRTSQSALSWQLHDQSNIESPVRRLASAKCYHIEQQSQNPTDFDPTDRSLSFFSHRS